MKQRAAQSIVLYAMDLEDHHGEFSIEAARERVPDASREWQPTRRYLERLAATPDWGEVIVAANLCFEPMVGTLLRRELGTRAAARQRRHGHAGARPRGDRRSGSGRAAWSTELVRVPARRRRARRAQPRDDRRLGRATGCPRRSRPAWPDAARRAGARRVRRRGGLDGIRRYAAALLDRGRARGARRAASASRLAAPEPAEPTPARRVRAGAARAHASARPAVAVDGGPASPPPPPARAPAGVRLRRDRDGQERRGRRGGRDPRPARGHRGDRAAGVLGHPRRGPAGRSPTTRSPSSSATRSTRTRSSTRCRRTTAGWSPPTTR